MSFHDKPLAIQIRDSVSVATFWRLPLLGKHLMYGFFHWLVALPTTAAPGKSDLYCSWDRMKHLGSRWKTMDENGSKGGRNIQVAGKGVLIPKAFNASQCCVTAIHPSPSK